MTTQTLTRTRKHLPREQQLSQAINHLMSVDSLYEFQVNVGNSRTMREVMPRVIEKMGGCYQEDSFTPEQVNRILDVLDATIACTKASISYTFARENSPCLYLVVETIFCGPTTREALRRAFGILAGETDDNGMAEPVADQCQLWSGDFDKRIYTYRFWWD